MNKTIKHSWLLNHSPEKVWDYLTKQELLAQWLMETDFQPIIGQKFTFNTKPKVKLGFDGMIYCQVLTLEPYKEISYSWRGGPGDGKVTLDSVVIWTLEAKDNGTQLTLEHKGFKGLKNYFSYLIMNKGWEKIGKRFAGFLAQ